MTNKYLFFLIVSFMCLSSCGDREGDEQRALLSKVTKGMSRDSVISILGQPAFIDSPINDNVIYFYYESKSNKLLQSGSPVIIFDSLGSVDLVSID